ncbi:Zinc finger ccch domain-containing protein [Thalictrum thalictroides]|uniref:Zinc finger ccch domain-containing protein n=1 Tax=Thalictrum thalictroides TaxID=46969 RepID=A0A7J6VZ74_THATH|nr:Zinc finger ccch domain-containing protein [Thalictrum thalictroides]
MSSIKRSSKKRKRGRLECSRSKTLINKEEEEDVCFRCYDGGDLVICDHKSCPKAYHLGCIGWEISDPEKHSFICSWHSCSGCEKTAHFMCYSCTYSLCEQCIKESELICVRGERGFCKNCLKMVVLTEKLHGNEEMDQVDFDDNKSREYFFRGYWIDLKEKLSFTFDELTQAIGLLKGTVASVCREEPVHRLDCAREERVGNIDGMSTLCDTNWASKELMDFVAHTNNGDTSVLSLLDVKALLLRYIKQNNLRDLHQKTLILCDSRLENLFGKACIGHFEMLRHLGLHLRKKDSRAAVSEAMLFDTKLSQIEARGNCEPIRKAIGDEMGNLQKISPETIDNAHASLVVHLKIKGNNESPVKARVDKRLRIHEIGEHRSPQTECHYAAMDTVLATKCNSKSLDKVSKDKRPKLCKKVEERLLQANSDDYAAIDIHNIGLIYLKRNLMEDFLEDIDMFDDKVVGCFVRIRIDSSQNQEMHKLVEVVGTGRAPQLYKTGERTTNVMLEILNISMKETIPIHSVSNQEFSEDECKCLRESIKLGLVSHMTVGQVQKKAMALQEIRVNNLLNSPEERRRRIQEIPEIHADPSMDPGDKSGDDTNLYDKRQGNHMKQKDTGFNSEGKPNSPEKGSLLSNMAWSRGREFSMAALESSKNMTAKCPSPKGDVANGFGEKTVGPSGSHESDSHQTNSFAQSDLNSGNVNDQVVVGSGSSSESVLASLVGEIDKMWNYQDPSGKTQGPFSILELCKWSRTASFPANLRIWKTMGTQEDSILLTEALDKTFSRSPKVTAAIENKRVDKVASGGNFLSGQLILLSTSSPGCSSHMCEPNDCSQIAYDQPTSDPPYLALVEKAVNILNPECKYNHFTLQHSSSPKADPGDYIMTSPKVARETTHPWMDNLHAVSQIDVLDLQTKSGESPTSSKVDAETRPHDISVSMTPLSNQLPLFSTSSPVSSKPMKGLYSCCGSRMSEPCGCSPLPSQSAHELFTKDDKITSSNDQPSPTSVKRLIQDSKNDHSSSQHGLSPKVDPSDCIMTRPAVSPEMTLLSWTNDPEMTQPSSTADLQNDVSDSQTKFGESPHTSSEMAGKTRLHDISAVVGTYCVSEPPQPSLDGALMDIDADSVISPSECAKLGSESIACGVDNHSEKSSLGQASVPLHVGNVNSGWVNQSGNTPIRSSHWENIGDEFSGHRNWGSHWENNGDGFSGHQSWGSHWENNGDGFSGHQSWGYRDSNSSHRSVPQVGNHQDNDTRKVPCRYYLNNRYCSRGAECGYIHDIVPCIYYNKGSCKNGNLCRFYHDEWTQREKEICIDVNKREPCPRFRDEGTMIQNQICKNNLIGICTRKESCRRIHVDETSLQNLVCGDYRRGCCVKGESCDRIHDVGTKEICKNNERGNCTKGENCYYLHL